MPSAPPRGLPAYTAVSGAMMEAGWEVPAMRAAFKNKKHNNVPVHRWPAAAAEMLPRLDF